MAVPTVGDEDWACGCEAVPGGFLCPLVLGALGVFVCTAKQYSDIEDQTTVRMCDVIVRVCTGAILTSSGHFLTPVIGSSSQWSCTAPVQQY